MNTQVETKRTPFFQWREQAFFIVGSEFIAVFSGVVLCTIYNANGIPFSLYGFAIFRAVATFAAIWLALFEGVAIAMWAWTNYRRDKQCQT